MAKKALGVPLKGPQHWLGCTLEKNAMSSRKIFGQYFQQFVKHCEYKNETLQTYNDEFLQAVDDYHPSDETFKGRYDNKTLAEQSRYGAIQ